MIDEQTNKIIDIIKTMNEKVKLRLAIALKRNKVIMFLVNSI